MDRRTATSLDQSARATPSMGAHRDAPWDNSRLRALVSVRNETAFPSDGSVAGEKGLGLGGGASVAFDAQAIEGGRLPSPKEQQPGGWITIDGG